MYAYGRLSFFVNRTREALPRNISDCATEDIVSLWVYLRDRSMEKTVQIVFQLINQVQKQVFEFFELER